VIDDTSWEDEDLTGLELPPFPDHIKLSVELVTPKRARWLKQEQHKNRHISRLEVGTLAAIIEEGNWYPEISPVYVDANGTPYDGQHRFDAIIETGKPQYVVFISGVREKAAEFIDTVRRRTHSDWLRMNDVPDYARRAVVSRMLALYAKYGIDGIRNPSSMVLTPSEKDAWVLADGMEEAVRAGTALNRGAKANASYAAYAVFQTMTSEIVEPGVRELVVDADGFWESVRTGAGLREGDPALTLRNNLMTGTAHTSKVGKVDPRLYELYLLATAWNKHVLGERWGKPAPKFEERNGQKFFPASNIPEFLPLSTRKRISDFKDAHAALQNARGAK
jgi:hypothetical protein